MEDTFARLHDGEVAEDMEWRAQVDTEPQVEQFHAVSSACSVLSGQDVPNGRRHSARDAR